VGLFTGNIFLIKFKNKKRFFSFTMEEMTLKNLRSVLNDLDAKVMDAFIRRSEYRQNLWLYEEPAQAGILTGCVDATQEDREFVLSYPDATYFGLKFISTELQDAKEGLFERFGERPFCISVPSATPEENYPFPTKSAEYFATGDIEQRYHDMIPHFCKPGMDDNYADAVKADIEVLRAVSRRVHHGELVMHLKATTNLDEYVVAANTPDKTYAEGKIVNLLTSKERENEVVEGYGAIAKEAGLDAELFMQFAKDMIGITKIVEV